MREHSDRLFLRPADPTETRLDGAAASSSQAIDFIRDVEPALTKAGCNMGACHGSFQGRGGFRLSLLGFDPTFDYDALVEGFAAGE